MEKQMLRWILVFALLVDVGLARAADKPVPAASASASVSGKVLEVKDVDNYTYLRLKTRDGEVWAAVSRAPVTPVRRPIVDANVMQNFESRTLNRKFDRIVSARSPDRARPPRRRRRLGALHAGAARPRGDIKVAKATGPDARTVAEVVTRRSELKDKPALVRGKVVKFTPAVMGKNWIHLRDGTGSAADGSNDVVVTTRDETKVGDVVLVKGVVRTDRDLGSGYSYKVLIEEASLQK
jgi:hypothetical protein